MRVAALIAILALAAVADASREDVLGRRSLLQSYKGHSDYKEPKYCKDWKDHTDCPKDHECVALDKKFCKSEPDCHKDAYGKEQCTYKQVCWEYHCVEKPRHCDPYAKYDECDKYYDEKEHGYEWECKKLDKPVCTYKDKCTPYKTDRCKEYGYEDKCEYVKGGCKTYAQKKECKYRDECYKYKQEKKCDKEKVCKEYKQITTCVDKCDGYDAYGNCNRYGKDCTYKKGPCKEYEYKEKDCKYVDTDYCIQYKKVEHDCKYVNTHCKEYKQEKKCHKVKKGCNKYEYKDKCEKVEDVCWKGKCVKKPPPPKYPPHKPDPKPRYPSHSPKYNGYGNGYDDSRG
ncbi:unnamed protein product [Ostreobium quekettii]|uniref:Uncharacterized protein n=1 Tax=Ostreobium quekettii TaxID=121088 RepID=A0A8S1J3A9_9CHLO|nr:unnamed protein product [Ostreobium quekettii]|eukprot:evm.model.scf_1048.5 EVM.evm.TU.scf_1048.5   scf_1048:35374-37514(-)